MLWAHKQETHLLKVHVTLSWWVHSREQVLQQACEDDHVL